MEHFASSFSAHPASSTLFVLSLALGLGLLTPLRKSLGLERGLLLATLMLSLSIIMGYIELGRIIWFPLVLFASAFVAGAMAMKLRLRLQGAKLS